jgi:hypothetical protein
MSRPPSDKSEPEGFARRWSRLKSEGREPKPPAPSAPPQATESEKKPEFDLSQLPSIESLTKDSDYSNFLRAEVPEELRRQALRKLWASDPVLAAPDPFDLHNVDYNAVFSVGEGVKTLVEAGKRMVDAVPESAGDMPAAAPEEDTSCDSALQEPGPEHKKSSTEDAKPA